MKLSLKMTADNADFKRGINQAEKAVAELRQETVEATGRSERLTAEVVKLGREGRVGARKLTREFTNITRSQQETTKATQQQTRTLKAAFLNMGRSGKRSIEMIQREMRELRQDMVKTTQETKRLSQQGQQSANAMSGAFGKVGRALGPLAASVGAAFGVSALSRYADQMTNMQNQLRLTVNSEEELISTREKLIGISNDARTSASATTELYTRMFRATRDLNLSQDDLLNVTDTINKSFVISGASVQETEGAVRQLSQALASGVFRGEEFNSVAEQGPRLMQALSEETGKSAGELRALAAEGKLTSDILISALINQSGKIKAEFATTDATIGQSTTVMNNAFMSLVGSVDDITGASTGASDGILSISKAIDDLADNLNSGAISTLSSGYAEEIKNLFGVTEESVEKANEKIKTATNEIMKKFDLVSGFFREIGTYWPALIQEAVGGVVDSFAHFRDVAPIYIQKAKALIEQGIGQLANRLNGFAKQARDALNPFDGDTFDYSAYVESEDKKLKIIKDARNKELDVELVAAEKKRLARAAILNKEVEDTRNRIDAIIAESEAAGSAYSNAGTPGVGDGLGRDKDEKVEPKAAATSKTLDELEESLLSEEELRATYLQRKIDMVNAEVAKEIELKERGQKIIKDLVAKHLEETDIMQKQRTMMMLGTSAQLFDGLAGIAKSFGGEQSKAYRAMFAVSKAFSVAQAGMNLSLAVSNAMASGPFPWNLGAMATVTTAGLGLVTSLKGAAFSGQAHDGLDRVPMSNEGTYMLKRGEMVMNPRQRENFDAMRDSFENGNAGKSNVYSYSFSPTLQIDASNGADESVVRRATEMAINEYDRMLQEDLASNGPRAQLLGGRAA